MISVKFSVQNNEFDDKLKDSTTSLNNLSRKDIFIFLETYYHIIS